VLLGRGLLDGLFPCSEESYKCLSDLRVVCCQLHVCATGRFLVQRSRMDVCLLGNLCVVRYRSCEGLIHFTEESCGCVSDMSVLCCKVEVGATC